MGLPVVGFLGQVKEVRFVEEEPGLHWLLLPACHRGCDTIEGPETAPSHGSCGNLRPTSGSEQWLQVASSLTTTLDRIHAVDDHVVRSLDMDCSVRDRVMKNPTEAFAQASQTLYGARPERALRHP